MRISDWSSDVCSSDLGETVKHQNGGYIDLTYTGAARSGADAFEEAGITPRDIQYASIYDSFTITVLMLLEDLGFCKKGEGGRLDRKSVVSGKRVSVRVDRGGRRIIKKKRRNEI